MDTVIQLIITKTWWTHDTDPAWYEQAYHWFNLFEAAVWFVVALLVFRRYWRYRKTNLEIVYGCAFITFGLSDLREAFVVQSWLIVLKAINLIVLVFLRRHLIRRYYMTSKAF